jgi:hypothetical protein
MYSGSSSRLGSLTMPEACRWRPVLVDHPFERRAIAEAILGDLGRDAVQSEQGVGAELGPVFRELHLFDPPVELAGFRCVRAGTRAVARNGCVT